MYIKMILFMVSKLKVWFYMIKLILHSYFEDENYGWYSQHTLTHLKYKRQVKVHTCSQFVLLKLGLRYIDYCL